MSAESFAVDFMKDVARGDVTRPLAQQAGPQARWMTVKEVSGSPALAYDPRQPGNKILIGALGKQLVGLADDRHVMTVAGSRSGKSVGLVSNLLFYAGSVLATDPKGELAALTAQRRAAMGQRVCVLDPFGLVTGEAARFRVAYNPMDVLDISNPTFLEDAALLAESIVVQPPDQRDAHWDESAKNFIEGVIVHVATAARYAGKRNLVTVRELLKKCLLLPSQAEETKQQRSAAQPVLFTEMLANADRLITSPELEDIGHAISAGALDFYSKGETERAGVQSTVNRHTKFLDYTAFRRVLTKSDVDLRDLKRAKEGLTIYLCFPATRMELSRRWMRIFVNQLLDAMEREKTKPAVPVLACLDEFPVLGYMKQLEVAAGLIASFDVKLWIVLQDWSQGKALYGDRWETFAGNAGLLQFFGNNDQTTTEYISKRLGRTQIEVIRRGEAANDNREKGLMGELISVELHDLLTPDEVSRQFSRDDRLERQLVIWAGHHPMILQRAVYYDKGSAMRPAMHMAGITKL